LAALGFNSTQHRLPDSAIAAPPNMDADLELSGEKLSQRTRIERADGTTLTEKYLARLCEKNFLSLWSYPGIYRDQGKKGIGDGKEICDLVVVFDNHVVIFSDKHCRLADSENLQLDWQRWFKKAIWKSAEQAWGAERWIREYPNRIFINRKCTQRLPIPLRPADRVKFHLVVVAHGISERIRKIFGGSGSLFVDSSLKGLAGHSMPFFCGDLAPANRFVHVLDDDSLHTVMHTRDTISDFVAYLTARERLFRGQMVIGATGEEQLLAIYLKNLNEQQQHDFVFPVENGEQPTAIFVDESHWEEFERSPERLAQLNADKVSYAWDKLIEKFNFYAMRGEQHFVTDGGIRDTERVLRFMAREPRWKRRYLAKSLLEMLRTTPAHQRRLRVLPPVDEGDPHYVFLLLPTIHAKTEEEYRRVRRKFLEGCCVVTKLQNREAKDIVGITTETGDGDGRSEDCLYLDAREWTTDMETHAKEVQARLGILKKPRQIRQHMQEYPSIPTTAGKVKNPRNKPCPCGSGKKYKHCCLGD
jgi:hypothetical protein